MMKWVIEMKIMTTCQECFNNFEIKDSYSYSKCINYLEINNELIIKGKCKEGHEIVVAVQGTGFETLFELGVLALRDGYNREAITSFAVAIERFHEFAIKVLMLELGSNIDQIESTWKHLSKQSERQLGAFYFIYLAYLKSEPPMIDNKKISFRNDVTHKGYIPSEEQAKDYEKFAFEYILNILILLKKNCNPLKFFEVITLNQKKYNQNPSNASIKTFMGHVNFFGSDSDLELISKFKYEDKIASFLKSQEQSSTPKYKK